MTRLGRHKQEIAALLAWAALLVLLALDRAVVLRHGQPARSRPQQRAAPAGRHRHDPRDPRGPDRHLGGLAVRDRQRVRGTRGQGGSAHAAPVRRGAGARSDPRRRERSPGGTPRPALDHRHPGHPRGLAGRLAVGDGGCVGAGPSRRLPVARPRPGRRPAPHRRRGPARPHRPGPGPTASRGGTIGLRRGLRSRGRAPRRYRARPRGVLRVRRRGRPHRSGRALERRSVLVGAQQPGPRPRAEGGGGRGRRGNGDTRRPRHASSAPSSASAFSAPSAPP